MKNNDPATIEGVGPAMASKLRSAGITTVEAIAARAKRELKILKSNPRT